MNSQQEKLIQNIENEYLEYTEELLTQSKNHIISESERTLFYANLLYYLREKQLNPEQINLLNQEDILKKTYECYLTNDYNHNDIMNNFGKLIYQFTKEQKFILKYQNSTNQSDTEM